MKLKNKITTIALASVLGLAGAAHGQVFSEDFGTIAGGTEITTSNTDLTYVRTSTASGALDPAAIDPSSFGTGSSAFLQSPSASLTGVGVRDTLPSSNIYTFAVDFRFSDVSAGDIVFGVGSGTPFTGNGTFSTAAGLFWLQSDNGNFERRTGGWANVGSGVTFANDTNYSLYVIANGSASPVTAGANTIAGGTMDIYLNGSLIDDGVAVTNSISADAFRIYSLNGTGVEIDNISLWDSAQPVPEPSAYALLAGLAGLGYVMVRRRRA